MKKIEFNPSYVGERPDIQALVPADSQMVLDVGCSTGALGEAIKRNTGASVLGIELSETMAMEARLRLDQVIVGDASSIIFEGKLVGHQFDVIVFADILEHLADPWGVLNAAVKYLAPGGVVIASIPNVRHIDTIWHLVFKGYWPYRSRGIHDQTHLRFFTIQNIREMFNQAGLSIDLVDTNYRILERPHSINRHARLIALPFLKNFLAFQYLLRAQVK